MRFRNGIVSLLVSASCAASVANSASGSQGGTGAYGYSLQQQRQQYGQQQYGQQPFHGQSDVQPSGQLEGEPVDDFSADDKPPLPEGWSEHFDPSSGLYYYYNSSDGTTTWDRPPPDDLGQEKSVESSTTSSQPNQEMRADGNRSADQDYPRSIPSGHNEYSAAEADVHNRQDIQAIPSSEERYWDAPQEEIQAEHKNMIRPQETHEQTPSSFESASTGATEENRPFKQTIQDGQLMTPDAGALDKRQHPYQHQPSSWGTPPAHETHQPHQHRPTQYRSGLESAVSTSESLPGMGRGAALREDETKPQENATGQPGWGLPNPESSSARQPSSWGVRKTDSMPQQTAQGGSIGPPPGQRDDSHRRESSGRQAQPQVPGWSTQDQGQQQRPLDSPASPQQAWPPPHHQAPQQHQAASTQPMPYGQPPAHRYGTYGSYGGPGGNGQYSQYRAPPQAYSQHPPSQSRPQPSRQVVGQHAEQGTSAVKEAFGRSLQSLIGFGNKTRDALGQARESVASSAAVASQSLTSKSSNIWDQAKNTLGSVFEGSSDNKNGEYSMSGQYRQPQQHQQAPSPGSRPPPGYSVSQNPYPRRYRGPPGQNVPSPQRQPPAQGQETGSPIQPRTDVPYPQTHRPQPASLRQTQYGGQGYPQRGYLPQQVAAPRQGGPAPQQGSGGPQPSNQEDGSPQGMRQPGRNPDNSGPPSDRSQRPQRQQAPQENPWTHPGLGGDA